MSLLRKPAAPQWLIVGLGNPGPRYRRNRHNAGFLCADVLAEAWHIKTDKLKFHALLGLGEIAGQRCVLMKPNTFMNESGRAAAECARFYQIPPERVLAVFDDITIAPGSLRIRRKGSAGGHNGVKSLIAHLGTEEFPRIKLGVAPKPDSETNLADWVLSDMGKEEQLALRAAIDDALATIPMILQGDIDAAMGKFSH